MRFDHDDLGRRTRRTTPTGARTHWSFDYLGRPAGMTADGHNIDFTYDQAGRLTRWQLDQLAIDTTYNPAGHPTRQTVIAHPPRLLDLGLDSTPRAPTQNLRTDEYTWRPDGYITNHTTHHPNTASTSRDYDLDPIGRVTTLTRDSLVAERYAYDPLSNITSAEIPTAATESVDTPTAVDTSGRREYRNNLLIRNGRTTYHYDNAGRLIRKTTTRLSRKPDTWHYRYNSFDQLTDVWTPDHQWWHYTYDALGRRTTKQHRTTDGDVLVRVDYTWDGTNLTEQTTSDTTTRWHYQPGTHTPLTQTTDQAAIDREFYAIITDLVGTPVQLVDPNTARQAAHAASDLWGQTVWRGHEQTPLRFAGQIYDPETGLHYNFHRYYDPQTGRYLTQDSLGLSPAPNPNNYPHNPMVWTDPLGLTPCSDGSGAAAPDSPRRTLYHYTNEEGLKAILESGNLRGSTGSVHARYGDGQYFTDIGPERVAALKKGDLTPGDIARGDISRYQLVQRLFGRPTPWGYGRSTHYVEIDVTDLDIVEGRPHVFLNPNEGDLDISGRIVSSGRTPF
ncbi:HYD1 signature containing ADP-ribosyltransferase family protein [Nocardia sp. NPDC058658]|uniref:HYD1 signature containing ADP-ribosyltransferase family protein n=1 Tax=Nocardia sp. NPDC058658 TaxID=3346580 RepID=UPI003660D29A